MPIRLDRSGRLALVTLDNPAKLNALSRTDYARLSAIWCEIRDDDDIWVAVVTGAGDRAFCVGQDLSEGTTPDVRWWRTQDLPLLNRGIDMWKPVVAAVNGYCIGGGMTLMLATDIRLCVPDAQFSVAETSVGLIPGNGGTQRLLRQVPYAVGMEMLLAGRKLDASEARSYGLVNEVVDPETLLERAMDVAGAICKRAPLAVRAAKELALRSMSLPLSDGLRLEEILLARLRGTTDAAEGRRAFMEHRPPSFIGR
jgi:E-phenylitaconyl-CoA hydratase